MNRAVLQELTTLWVLDGLVDRATYLIRFGLYLNLYV